jgi:L-amino acid N-acyltransferase YncA
MTIRAGKLEDIVGIMTVIKAAVNDMVAKGINCYEKSGFIKVKLLHKQELHEGEFKDCWLMEYDTR